MRRSRIVQILNVPLRVRFRSSLAAALLDGLFEHPETVEASAPFWKIPTMCCIYPSFSAVC